MSLLEKIEFPNLFSGDIDINRVAFNLFGIDVYWYGILIAIGVVIAFSYAMHRAKKVGMIKDDVFDVVFISIIFGFIGARAYYCIFFNNPVTGERYDLITAITGIHDGGLAIYGGIIAAVITAVIACKIKKIPVTPILDLAGEGFLIGQAIGRWGNFINQEAFGAPTAGNLPWGMTGTIIAEYPEVIEAQEKLGAGEYALVHPCFLYESLWCVVGFLLLHFICNRIRSFDGEVFLYYVLWYGSGRAWIEGLRTDSLYIGSLRVSQIVAIASAVLALIMIIYFRIYVKKQNKPLYVNTEESRKRLEDFEKTLKLEKEKVAAKKAMRAAEKEHSAPVAPSILGDEETEDKNGEDN